jgi:hypothetical protein
MLALQSSETPINRPALKAIRILEHEALVVLVNIPLHAKRVGCRTTEGEAGKLLRVLADGDVEGRAVAEYECYNRSIIVRPEIGFDGTVACFRWSLGGIAADIHCCLPPI